MYKLYRKRGSVSTRSILALLITMSILPIAVSIMTLCFKLELDYSLVNSELALMDLRRVLLLSYDLKIFEDRLEFIYHGKDFSLSRVNEKLILQPGTEIYLSDIEKLSFFTRNGSIYVSYTSGGKEYERNIGKEKGIYLADFSDDNDQLSDNNDGGY